jgi:hypothetical protein
MTGPSGQGQEERSLGGPSDPPNPQEAPSEAPQSHRVNPLSGQEGALAGPHPMGLMAHRAPHTPVSGIAIQETTFALCRAARGVPRRLGRGYQSQVHIRQQHLRKRTSLLQWPVPATVHERAVCHALLRCCVRQGRQRCLTLGQKAASASHRRPFRPATSQLVQVRLACPVAGNAS